MSYKIKRFTTEADTLYTFLKRCKKFSHDNLITSGLIIDGEETVRDYEWLVESKVGGIIAGIDNEVFELTSLLVEHFEKEGNKKAAERYRKIYEMK